MNNREKCKDELIETIKKDGKICGFMKKHNDALQPLGLNEKDFCDEIDCYVCATMLQLWLDEEYVEPEPPKPEVDWDNVPVDTLVRVKDFAADVGVLRYFKGINACNPVERFVAWADGKTSITANGSCTNWAFCELAEDLEEK